MNESCFNPTGIFSEVEIYSDKKISSSGRYNFSKQRLYGVLHFVKSPAEKYVDDLLTLESLRKEFYIGYLLNHPGIVKYHKFENNSIFEEFIDGKTLREIIDSKDTILQDPKFVFETSRQILEALDYILDNGIIHNDLKPENVMVTRIGNKIKIIDFGCAESAGNNSTPGFTPEYKAPEQGDGITNTYTDIYHAGRIINELTAFTQERKKWKNFLAKALNENPSLRYQTAKEALRDLPGIKKRNLKPIYFILGPALLFSAVVILFILNFTGNKNETQKRFIDENSLISDLSENEKRQIETDYKVNQENNEGSTINSESSKKEIEKLIKIRIELFYENDLSDHITPYGEKWEAYQNAPELDRAEEYREYNDVLNKNIITGLELSMNLIDDLSAQYPDYSDFIIHEVSTTFDTSGLAKIQELTNRFKK